MYIGQGAIKIFIQPMTRGGTSHTPKYRISTHHLLFLFSITTKILRIYEKGKLIWHKTILNNKAFHRTFLQRGVLTFNSQPIHAFHFSWVLSKTTKWMLVRSHISWFPYLLYIFSSYPAESHSSIWSYWPLPFAPKTLDSHLKCSPPPHTEKVSL